MNTLLQVAARWPVLVNCEQREMEEVGSKVERDALGGGGEAVGDVEEEEREVVSSQETATGRGEGRSERAGGQHALKGGGGESRQGAIRDGGQSALRGGGEVREGASALRGGGERVKGAAALVIAATLCYHVFL